LRFQTLKTPNVAFSTIRNIPIENSKRSCMRKTHVENDCRNTALTFPKA
jgi:hypothetical protein